MEVSRLVANHSVIVSFAGQRNAVGYGKRNFVIIFIESFDGYFEGIALSPVQSYATLADLHIAERILVGIESVIVFKAESGVGRQLIIESCVSAQRPVLRQLIGERQAGRKLVGQVFHGCRVVVGIGTQSQRSRKTLVYGGVIDCSEKSPAHDAQIGMIVERLRTVGVYLLKGGVAILAIVQTGSDGDFPVAERRTVLKTEL